MKITEAPRRIIEAVIAELRANTSLTEKLGDAVRLRRSRDFIVQEQAFPLVQYTITSETPGPWTATVTMQFDIFGAGLLEALELEAEIRALHSDFPYDVGGLRMWAQIEGARDNPDPAVDVVHRTVEFRFQTVRDRAHGADD